jgi:SsrA-binding protein
MAKKKTPSAKTITNRRARFDYELGDNLVAGLELTGAEAKALRLGHGQLRGAYVTFKDGELFLLNATINRTNGIPISDTEQTRTRKLLIKKREIDHLIAAKQQGKSIIPLEILTRGRYIKIRISVGTGKKQYDKRHALKAKDEKRSMNAAMKAGR